MQKEGIDSKQKNKTKKIDSVKKSSKFNPTVEDELAVEHKLDMNEWHETQWSKYIKRPENKNKSRKDLLEGFNVQ